MDMLRNYKPGDASAILELHDTAKGFLPPRVTYPVRKLMTNVPIGLMIWCSNCGVNGEMEVYTRNGWTTVTGGTTAAFVPDSLFVGEEYNGGIIAYILQPFDPGYSATTIHGLIAAFSDETIALGGAWYYVTVSNSIALGTAIGTGNGNTNAIVAAQPSPPYTTPALVCYNYSSQGYSDWYLPSKDELNMLYINRALIGGFGNGIYWSSTNNGSGNTAWYQDFSNGTQTAGSVMVAHTQRAIRSF
jgi:hypothetical protein